MKLMTAPKNPFLDRFPSIFLLAPCHLILSKLLIKSCLSIAMATWQNFSLKKITAKMLRLCGPAADKPEVV
jgi:hypothetical protein